jgi:phosphoinositide-3-kinase regulatory subunit 4
MLNTLPLAEHHVASWLQTNIHSVCAMYASSTDQSPFLLTGGTDMRLRYWDLDSPADSYLAVPAANDSLGPSSVVYK